ncbi:MAG: hypothetical protein JWP87_1424 [Labilithrix sp.]|nr:hypothetical protein [Labilithrix sp.]
MRRSLARAAASIAGAIVVVAAGRAARADEAADTATARALGVEGVTLANAGNCKEAVPKLERAEKLHHAPTTATRLAECEIERGFLVRGTERLQRVIREPLPANAHAAFGAAVVRARKVLETTLPRVAALRIEVDAPPGTRLSMTVDDEPTSDAVVDTDRPIDPGTHTIKVSAEGFLSSSVTESLDEGQTKSVRLELRPDPNARAAAVRARAGLRNDGGAGLGTAGADALPSKVPAVLAFGVGAIGLGLGIAGAVIVDQKESRLSTNCDANKVCGQALQSELSDAKTWATVSTAGFVAAGVGTVTGIALLLFSGGSPVAPATGARVRPSVGATSVGIDGVF